MGRTFMVWREVFYALCIFFNSSHALRRFKILRLSCKLSKLINLGLCYKQGMRNFLNMGIKHPHEKRSEISNLSSHDNCYRIQAREPIKTKSAKVRNKRLQKKAHQFQKKASEDLKYALLHGSQGLRQHMLGSRGENTHWSGIQGSPTIKLIR
ncbi:hypothetical protein SUGI_0722730 [Cryptomeria japonica]|nr:hypothetical protein SUGI_0722730 [Cryptomeria japonica]